MYSQMRLTLYECIITVIITTSWFNWPFPWISAETWTNLDGTNISSKRFPESIWTDVGGPSLVLDLSSDKTGAFFYLSGIGFHKLDKVAMLKCTVLWNVILIKSRDLFSWWTVKILHVENFLMAVESFLLLGHKAWTLVF